MHTQDTGVSIYADMQVINNLNIIKLVKPVLYKYAIQDLTTSRTGSSQHNLSKSQ